MPSSVAPARTALASISCSNSILRFALRLSNVCATQSHDGFNLSNVSCAAFLSFCVFFLSELVAAIFSSNSATSSSKSTFRVSRAFNVARSSFNCWSYSAWSSASFCFSCLISFSKSCLIISMMPTMPLDSVEWLPPDEKDASGALSSSMVYSGSSFLPSKLRASLLFFSYAAKASMACPSKATAASSSFNAATNFSCSALRSSSACCIIAFWASISLSVSLMAVSVSDLRVCNLLMSLLYPSISFCRSAFFSFALDSISSQFSFAATSSFSSLRIEATILSIWVRTFSKCHPVWLPTSAASSAIVGLWRDTFFKALNARVRTSANCLGTARICTKVLVAPLKAAWASGELRISTAFSMPASSSVRNRVRVAQSFAFSRHDALVSSKNFSSASSCALVSSRSCCESASTVVASAFSASFLSKVLCRSVSSLFLAAMRSSNTFKFSASVALAVSKLDVKVSNISFKIPTISFDAGAYESTPPTLDAV
mmetsp:Transcript_81546/g.218196  ORF Transcript_81546/g.218196 Transcript_81546/m.218196 type:complete len:486 (+) Transcript_81546:137-1594(+)